MTTSSWKGDEHGTLVLPGSEIGLEHGFAWIQPRRSYCDRGHWDWGTQGLPFYSGENPEPSHYFMRLDNGIAEIEAWLARNLGAKHQGKRLSDLADSQAFSHGEGQGLAWKWERQGNTLTTSIESEEGTVQASLREKQTATGTVFVFDVEKGIPTLDDSDRFPRTYLDLDRALDEIETFFAWRLLKVPTEIPYRLDKTDKLMGKTLSQAVASQTAQPKARRPKP